MAGRVRRLRELGVEEALRLLQVRFLTCSHHVHSRMLYALYTLHSKVLWKCACRLSRRASQNSRALLPFVLNLRCVWEHSVGSAV